MSLFRAYDIRGIYPTEINEDLGEKIGKAFGTLLFERLDKPSLTVAVGGDVRVSTPSIKKRTIEGLLSTGANVIDIGMVHTPALYFAVAHLRLDGGLGVTASHNPKEYNGFKPVGPGGACLSWETGISRLQELVQTGAFRQEERGGNLITRSVDDDYISHVTGNVQVRRKLKVVVDAANGATSIVGPKVFERLGWSVVPLFCEPDGTFPNHEADPIKKKNLLHLQQKVKDTHADLGISFDGDGDRLGIVNEKGEIVENNKILSLFIKDTLLKKPHSSVVYEVVVSKVVEDTIKKYGGIPSISRVGHSYIQQALAEKKAALAGENSGHYYFPENYGYDDAVFAALKTAELLNEKPLSEREKEIPDYVTSEEMRPFCADERKFLVVEELQNTLKKEGHRLIDIDGARVLFDKGWCIIRASNTGPQLVVRWEAENNEHFEKIGHFVKDHLQAFGVNLS